MADGFKAGAKNGLRKLQKIDLFANQENQVNKNNLEIKIKF